MYFSRPSLLLAYLIGLVSVPLVVAVSFEDVEHSFDTLQAWYDPDIGLWIPSTGWWNSANCVSMLASLATIDPNIRDRTNNLWQEIFTRAPAYNAGMTKKNGRNWQRRRLTKKDLRPRAIVDRNRNVGSFLNDFYDDEGWWALAWITVYDLTGDDQFLNEAVTIFDDMHAAYNSTPVGGLYWNKKKQYVNAIANELYISVAAHLANRKMSLMGLYLSFALESWNWFYASGMINERNNIQDGIAVYDGYAANMPIVWSCKYSCHLLISANVPIDNQGVILSALVELFMTTGQESYLKIARTIADAALTNLTSINCSEAPNLILHDPCEATASCGTDGASFKGIFARNLARLHSVSPQDRYAEFLMENAQSLWEYSRDQYNRLGIFWGGPFTEPANASTQCSGMDVLVAALAQLGEWTGIASYQGGKVVGSETTDSQSSDLQKQKGSVAGESDGEDGLVKAEPLTSRAGRARTLWF